VRKLTRLSWLSLLTFAVGFFPAAAQVKQAGGTRGGADSSGQSLLERGKYIVENVAMCELCHTPRDENGNPDRGLWLMGGPTQLRPSYPSSNWAINEPKIGGGPPGTDAEFIKLLTTGIARTGSPPKPPMPPFRMTRPDAEAVLAYLKSLRH
jgi:mono/diheme cytochrome c family protein